MVFGRNGRIMFGPWPIWGQVLPTAESASGEAQGQAAAGRVAADYYLGSGMARLNVVYQVVEIIHQLADIVHVAPALRTRAVAAKVGGVYSGRPGRRDGLGQRHEIATVPARTVDKDDGFFDSAGNNDTP